MRRNERAAGAKSSTLLTLAVVLLAATASAMPAVPIAKRAVSDADGMVAPMANSSDFAFWRLFPRVPADAVASRYNAPTELRAWADVSIFTALALDLPGLTRTPVNMDDARMVLAPTNDAFFSLFTRLYPEELHLLSRFITEDMDAESIFSIFNRLAPVFQVLNSPEGATFRTDFVDVLKSVIDYHLVPDQEGGGTFSEWNISSLAAVRTVNDGKLLNTSAYPLIVDVNGDEAIRYARLINTTTANVAIIDRVLLPAPTDEIKAALPKISDVMALIPNVRRAALHASAPGERVLGISAVRAEDSTGSSDGGHGEGHEHGHEDEHSEEHEHGHEGGPSEEHEHADGGGHSEGEGHSHEDGHGEGDEHGEGEDHEEHEEHGGEEGHSDGEGENTEGSGTEETDDFFPDTDGTLPTPPSYAPPFAPPLQSMVSFIQSRNDLALLGLVVHLFPTLRDKLWNANQTVHVCAPNNDAFLKLIGDLLPDVNDRLGGLVENVTSPLTNLTDVLTQVVAVVQEIADLPTLSEIVEYHVLLGSANLPDRVGTGPQRTVLGADATVTVSSKDGLITLEDADSNRKNPTVVATHATLTGYVSVLDGVLTSFKTDDIFSGVPSSTDEGDEGDEGDGGDDASPSEEPDNVCFPAHARVTLHDDSTVRMADLQAGHHVRVHPGQDGTSPVFLFTHRKTDGVHKFVRVATDKGHVLTLTASHYVYVRGVLRAAGSVRVGDMVETDRGDAVVTDVSHVLARGLYAPHSAHGDLVVDGVRVSGYSTAVHPGWAHVLLAPLRLLAATGVVREPLGAVFYHGADRLVGFLPRGRKVY